MRACLGALLVLMTGGSGLMAQSFDFTAGTQSFFTESGIPVIFRVPKQEPGPVQEVVSLRISAFGGVELTEKAGALDLLSGLLMRGTYSYSKDQIDDLLTRTGARLSVSADQDSVELSLRCLRRFLPELLPLVSEIVRVPKMEERELKLLIEQQVAALKSEQDRPESVIALKMNQIFFSGHPYQRRPSGYLESIREIKREDLHSLLFRTFNRQNVVVTLVGDFQVEEVKALIDEHFRSLPEGQRTNPTRAIPNNDFSQTHFTSFNSPTTYFLARFKSPALDDEDFPALTIGMQILHNRLFEEVRTNRGLAYSVSARPGNSRVNTGSLFVFSIDIAQAVAVMFEEVKKMKEQKVEQDEIDLQIKKYLSSWYMGRETRSQQSNILAFYELMGIGWENSGSFIHRLQRVDADAIQRAMTKHLRDMSVAVVGQVKPDISPILRKHQALSSAPPEASTE